MTCWKLACHAKYSDGGGSLHHWLETAQKKNARKLIIDINLLLQKWVERESRNQFLQLQSRHGDTICYDTLVFLFTILNLLLPWQRLSETDEKKYHMMRRFSNYAYTSVDSNAINHREKSFKTSNFPWLGCMCFSTFLRARWVVAHTAPGVEIFSFISHRRQPFLRKQTNNWATF